LAKTSRITISIPKKLLDEFDLVLNGRSYRSRSKGIQDALKDWIKRHESMNEIKGEKIGTLSIIYDHYYNGLVENINNIKQDYHKYINSVINVHLTKNQSLEVIIVKGDIRYIYALRGKIMNLKGLEEVKLTTTSMYSIKETSINLLK
jgi:CopG family transcriptional regulator, nickel-responsive regulator